MVIALDIALNKTGIAITADGKRFKTMTLEPKKSWKYFKKIAFLSDEFDKMFETHLTFGEEPLLIMEGRLKAGWSGATLASIEGARVTAYLSYLRCCERLGLKPNFVVYPPDEVKYSLSGNRTSGKEAMYEAAISRFSFLKRLEYQEDEFDAMYLVLHHDSLVRKDKNVKSSRKNKRK